ncbi:MAG: N-acetylmuramoyl-L-alanine amidase family protein [Christensenellaceae bacterium]|jgi:N-acetylmuramoyl-L-alanine amidase
MDQKRYQPKTKKTFSLKSLSKKQWIIILAAIAAAAVLLLLLVFLPKAEEAAEEEDWMEIAETVELTGLKAVIDAGHGGFDNGTVGVSTGRLEKEVNLEIAKRLQAAMANEGMNVVMTRETGDAIAPSKDEDMDKRVNIILEEAPDMFISIHQNSAENAEATGPQVFYLMDGSEGKKLAVAIQQSLNDQLEIESPRIALAGDYTLLKPGAQPSCIVECGFFSNAEEEKLLQTPEYQEKIVAAIIDGVKLYVMEHLNVES